MRATNWNALGSLSHLPSGERTRHKHRYLREWNGLAKRWERATGFRVTQSDEYGFRFETSGHMAELPIDAVLVLLEKLEAAK